MRDKLKRRKKSEESASQQPPPLQPAYFEPKDEPREARLETPPEPEQAAEARPERLVSSHSTPAPAAVDANVTANEIRRPRRRRGRGGRGRKRAGQPAPAATEPVAEMPPAAPAIPTPPQITPSASKGLVVLAIGLPGSGKSSWFKRHNIAPLSSDLVRQVLFDDPAEQRFQDLVFSNLRSMLRARLIARRPLNYLDATNLTPHDRHSWIKLAKDFGYEPQAVYFDVPLEVCLERNQKRQRVVSEDVMRKMAAKMKPPSFGEGFTKITVVRVKQKE